MKKWGKPELKVLGVENTFEGTSTFGTQAGTGYKWVCNNCKGEIRNDIDDRPPTPTIGDIITTPHQSCGRCGKNTWIRVGESLVAPPYNPEIGRASCRERV